MSDIHMPPKSGVLPPRILPRGNSQRLDSVAIGASRAALFALLVYFMLFPLLAMLSKLTEEVSRS